MSAQNHNSTRTRETYTPPTDVPTPPESDTYGISPLVNHCRQRSPLPRPQARNEAYGSPAPAVSATTITTPGSSLTIITGSNHHHDHQSLPAPASDELWPCFNPACRLPFATEALVTAHYNAAHRFPAAKVLKENGAKVREWPCTWRCGEKFTSRLEHNRHVSTAHVEPRKRKRKAALKALEGVGGKAEDAEGEDGHVVKLVRKKKGG
ncbi:hypothetical protein H2201_003468 [Coniosporium apollinis]|uniref:C2H2-type domain-containing protein n=1 Tax=Coniosporium apollinis TaxID=61459 RepID=A0ABQ9NVY4_9PEZI|nr:hypothetical protein H2201_003468 [Coniosporium apollinis]